MHGRGAVWRRRAAAANAFARPKTRTRVPLLNGRAVALHLGPQPWPTWLLLVPPSRRAGCSAVQRSASQCSARGSPPVRAARRQHCRAALRRRTDTKWEPALPLFLAVTVPGGRREARRAAARPPPCRGPGIKLKDSPPPAASSDGANARRLALQPLGARAAVAGGSRAPAAGRGPLGTGQGAWLFPINIVVVTIASPTQFCFLRGLRCCYAL